MRGHAGLQRLQIILLFDGFEIRQLFPLLVLGLRLAFINHPDRRTLGDPHEFAAVLAARKVRLRGRQRHFLIAVRPRNRARGIGICDGEKPR
jgi:hypothetical protein